MLHKMQETNGKIKQVWSNRNNNKTTTDLNREKKGTMHRIFPQVSVYIPILNLQFRSAGAGFKISMSKCDLLSQKGYKVAEKITRQLEKTSQWVISQFIGFLLFHIVGHRFYHMYAHNPFWPTHDFKTHFNWQQSTLTKAAPFSQNGHSTSTTTLL